MFADNLWELQLLYGRTLINIPMNFSHVENALNNKTICLCFYSVMIQHKTINLFLLFSFQLNVWKVQDLPIDIRSNALKRSRSVVSGQLSENNCSFCCDIFKIILNSNDMKSNTYKREIVFFFFSGTTRCEFHDLLIFFVAAGNEIDKTKIKR